MVFGTSRSPWTLAPFGLPQGSVLASLLYLLYTSGIGTLLSSYRVLSQLYADDTQTYLHCPSTAAMGWPLVPCTRQWGPLQIGCPQTDSASMPKKPNSFGWSPGSSWQS